jgi:methyl-accepting chemotaxis protein
MTSTKVKTTQKPATERHLDPPERGDLAATRWMFVGIAFYLILSSVLLLTLVSEGTTAPEPLALSTSVRELVGLGQHKNLSVFVLVIGGIVLTVVAFVQVAQDIVRMRTEENDIEWLFQHQREGLWLVLLPPKERKARWERGDRSVQLDDAALSVETLMDDRVRRVYAARATGSVAVSAEELRVIAEKRTARFGSFARYGSSLLLLLAVLGTFAGVKTALPRLIQAIAAGEGEVGAAGVNTSIVEPLRAVSDAFGGNALALIGAIAVGVMAQGLAVGRRNLLERLELASVEYLFGKDEKFNVASPLESAVHALHDAAKEINASTGSLLGIEQGLQGLGSDFKAAFASLDTRMAEILEHQEKGLYGRTSEGLERLQLEVGKLASYVDAHTRLYTGLVESVGHRSEETREALRRMRETNEQLTKALTAILQMSRASDEATLKFSDLSRHLSENSDQLKTDVEKVASLMLSVEPALNDVRKSIDGTQQIINSIDARAVQVWGKMGNEITDRLAAAIDVMIKQVVAALPAADRRPLPVASSPTATAATDLAPLLSQINKHLREQNERLPSPLMLALVPLLSVLAGAWLVYVILG